MTFITHEYKSQERNDPLGCQVASKVAIEAKAVGSMVTRESDYYVHTLALHTLKSKWFPFQLTFLSF